MSLDRVCQLLNDRAEVAEVAEVFGGRAMSVRHAEVHRLPRSCRGFSKTYTPVTMPDKRVCEERAEVAEVFLSLNACAGARTRARGAQSGNRPMQPTQPMHALPSSSVTVLKHCRCMDCRYFHRMAGEYYCTEYVGGTKVRWIDGYRQCAPPPDAWHYCAFYHGPQISKDIWIWKYQKGEAS